MYRLFFTNHINNTYPMIVCDGHTSIACVCESVEEQCDSTISVQNLAMEFEGKLYSVPSSGPISSICTAQSGSFHIVPGIEWMRKRNEQMLIPNESTKKEKRNHYQEEECEHESQSIAQSNSSSQCQDQGTDLDEKATAPVSISQNIDCNDTCMDLDSIPTVEAPEEQEQEPDPELEPVSKRKKKKKARVYVSEDGTLVRITVASIRQFPLDFCTKLFCQYYDSAQDLELSEQEKLVREECTGDFVIRRKFSADFFRKLSAHIQGNHIELTMKSFRKWMGDDRSQSIITRSASYIREAEEEKEKFEKEKMEERSARHAVKLEKKEKLKQERDAHKAEKMEEKERLQQERDAQKAEKWKRKRD